MATSPSSFDQARQALDRDDLAAAERLIAALPPSAGALHLTGLLRHKQQRLAEAEGALKQALAFDPRDPVVRLALASVLLDRRKAAEAFTLLDKTAPLIRGAADRAHFLLDASELRRAHGDYDGALAACGAAAALDPTLAPLDRLRADAADALNRFPDALAALERILARDPLNLAAHAHYNGLLYRLGRSDFLASFDRAPQTPQIRAAKASYLLRQERAAEAESLYAGLAAENPGEAEYLVGLGVARAQRRDFAAAIAALEQAAARAPHDAGIPAHLATTLLLARDPQKAAAMAERGRALAPHDQFCLALLGTAWRAMGDARDEDLNGYDHLIRVFDLEPPRGFTDMETFNAELTAYLAGLHPDTGNFIDQTQRGGTKTLNKLFGTGHDLVDRIEERILEALNRYAAEIAVPPDHPFARMARNARVIGSWSSRLRDCGYHANHVHPGGWISSCYYAGVPDAVRDETARQGWIKFGEPSFDAGLTEPVRRAVQPRPGRLVLFPSYMWHGTVPFHAATARTTIAFDAVPA